MKAMKSPLLLVLVLAPGLLLSADPLPRGIIALPGHGAPSFEVEDMDGARFALTEARGRWVFLHFWASWCGPCRKEIPAIQRLVAGITDKEPLVVLINTAEDEDTLFEFLSEFAPDLFSYMDPDGEVTEVWKPRGLPATYLIDPAGVVRYQALGGLPWDTGPHRRFLGQLVP